MSNYEFKMLESSSWEDDEPDRLTVAVSTSTDNGKAYVTFTCSCTWLDAATVRDEIIPFLQQCCQTADLHNILKELKENRDIGS